MARRAGIAIGADRGVAEVLAGLQARARGERLALHVALLPPLVQLRTVELPHMSESDARRVIGRNASRYFSHATEPLTMSLRRMEKGWLVAAAPASIVSAIHEAAKKHRWDVDAIVPAHAAWARAGDGLLEIALEGERIVLEVATGALARVRRFRPDAVVPEELAKRRVVAADSAGAAALAASHATRVTALDLVPDQVRDSRMRGARRLGWAISGAAAAMLLVAAVSTFWGEHRELAALRAQRETLGSRVQEALSNRESLLTVAEKVNFLAALERSAQPWSTVVARVAEALPGDASLIAFRAEADSVSLEGQARDASGVFAAMRSTPGFLAVRASAPVRQEGGGAGAPVVERFTMAARLDAPGAGARP